MPDFDRRADIKLHRDAGLVTAELPLAGHASSHWLSLFHNQAAKHWPGPAPTVEAIDRPDRTWVIVTTSAVGPARNPAVLMDAVSALIRKINASDHESDSDSVARAETAIRGWWERQQQ
jgi:hypothetical protein